MTQTWSKYEHIKFSMQGDLHGAEKRPRGRKIMKYAKQRLSFHNLSSMRLFKKSFVKFILGKDIFL